MPGSRNASAYEIAYYVKDLAVEANNGMLHVFSRDAARGKRCKRKPEPRQLSHNPSYVIDLYKYEGRDEVIELIKEIEEHLKDREDEYLAIHHDVHQLDREYEGFWSLKLYPGERGRRRYFYSL